MKATLICNPQSGGIWQRQKPIDRICRLLADQGIESDCQQTSGPGAATTIAHSAAVAGVPLVIAYGGDGTINEVIAGLAGSGATLGIIPGGTANVLAGELRIPCDLGGAVGVLSSGRRTSISVGKAGRRYFHMVAGIGLDAAVVSTMPLGMKRCLGKSAFWIQGVRQLRAYDLQPFKVEVDGQSHEVTFAVIANARSYGGTLVIAPYADVRSDCLDVCLFQTKSKSRFFLYLAAVLLGKHLKLEDVTYLQAKRAQAHGNSTIGIQVDGEVAGQLPMSFEIVPRCLSVLTPAV
jgi:YegS/Rv2252/BmrU family lipid kinase